MRNIYTPSELNKEVRLHLETGFRRLVVEGEISNLARPASGHLYFSLKDEKAQIRCALFRGNARGLSFRPNNGQLVEVTGKLSLYEARGEYQLIADSMSIAGEGRLRAAYDALKKKLEAEGLFDEASKQSLPANPSRIAVITSPTGAVIRDIIHVLDRRWPAATVRLYPVPVQGLEAPLALNRAVESVNRHRWADAVIIGRGGGSLEDLWAFNDEGLARVIHASRIPVISAVGHETDFSISDFVADVRAPTPSAAAEMLVPDQQEFLRSFRASLLRLERAQAGLHGRLSQRVDEFGSRLSAQHPERKLKGLGENLAQYRRRLVRMGEALVPERQRDLEMSRDRLASSAARVVPDQQRALEPLAQRLTLAARQLLPDRRRSLASIARTLQAVSPLPTLDRGYAIVRNSESGKAVRSAREVSSGDRLTTQLADGQIVSTVDSSNEDTSDLSRD